MSRVLVLDTHVESIEYRGQRVATPQMVANLHRFDVKRVHENFSYNKDRFVEGRDFYKLEGQELQEFKNLPGNSGLVSPHSPSLILFTERGYIKLATTFKDDRSWQLIDAMTDAYFAIRHMIENPQPVILSPIQKIDALRASLELAESFDLIDDYTRIVAREAIQNHIRMIGAIPGQEYTPASRQIGTGYFQVEALRDKLETKMKDKHWMNIRGTLGKMIGLAIQAANPDVKPLKVAKFVNGEERYVNAWPNEYMDIATAAAEQHLARASSQRD